MAALTQEGAPHHQHGGLGGAVRVVAIPAVFPDGLMFPQIRATLFSMALITGFIDRVLDENAAWTSVWVVTVRTQYLAFPSRVP